MHHVTSEHLDSPLFFHAQIYLFLGGPFLLGHLSSHGFYWLSVDVVEVSHVFYRHRNILNITVSYHVHSFSLTWETSILHEFSSLLCTTNFLFRIHVLALRHSHHADCCVALFVFLVNPVRKIRYKQLIPPLEEHVSVTHVHDITFLGDVCHIIKVFYVGQTDHACLRVFTCKAVKEPSQLSNFVGLLPGSI
jgi:hypothetical protein